MTKNTEDFGRIEISTIPLPEGTYHIHPTYTFSGKILLGFNTEDDLGIKDYQNIAVVNDDGTEFRTIFSDVIPKYPKANGIRFMPFTDNKRVLLGDYVLECYPDIDNCETTKLVPVKYPWNIYDDQSTYMHWSEIIISPDNKYICWTMLRSDVGAANGIGELVRYEDKYIIENPKVISSSEFLEEDSDNEGYMIPQPLRGGEVKQFVKGGTAISLVGAKDSVLPDSVVQDLTSDEITQITRVPGYDETTIFSPDEKLGIVMSTRGSEKTNFAILGHMPRPHSNFSAQGIIQHAYFYAVTCVRNFRNGNVGPVLIDIEKSMESREYKGEQLNDPEGKWVYLSPMSWHPNNKSAIWPEMIKRSMGNPDAKHTRIRKVDLIDYKPKEAVPVQDTPTDIPYGIENGLDSIDNSSKDNSFRIKGRYSGYVEVIKTSQQSFMGPAGTTDVIYNDYSDDGKIFYNGYEKSSYSLVSESTYESKLLMTGAENGEMNLKITFSAFDNKTGMINLVFDKDENDEPKSYGFAEYMGKKLLVVDMK